MPKHDIHKLREQALGKAAKKMQELKNVNAAKNADTYVDLPELTGDVEQDSAADLSALQEGFRKRAQDEGKRFELATDTEYWACFCFQSREQSMAFLKALNLLQLGDKYVDGVEAARMLGIQLPPAEIPFNTSSKVDKTWSDLT